MSQNQSPPEPPETLIHSLQWILRPLVKLLIYYKITLPQLVQWLKTLYVDVADHEFPVAGKEQSDSRVSMLTGVHRKDVRQLRHHADTLPHQAPISLGAQIVARWLSHPDYLDPSSGIPRPLPFELQVDGAPSFSQLVADVSRQDIRARVILDDWLQSRMVIPQESGLLALNQHAFVTNEDFEGRARLFGRILHDHVATSSANLMQIEQRQFDRMVYYNNLSAESLQQLTAMLDQEAMALLVKLNNEANRLQQRDHLQEAGHRKHRFSVGIFQHQEEQK